jgi:hypothetical protein
VTQRRVKLMVGWSSATLPIWGQTFFDGGFCIFSSEALFIGRSF